MANAYSPTYNSLLLEIPDICEDSNPQFIGNIPNFLARAQDQVMRDIQLESWRGYFFDSIGATVNYLRQASWLRLNSIFLPAGGGSGGIPVYPQKFLEKRSVDWLRTYNNPTYGAPPKYWAEDYINPNDPTNSYLLFAPFYVGTQTPQPTFPVRFDVFTRFAPLSSTNQTNWITNNVGDLLLYQALIHAHTYLINPEAVQQMGALYGAISEAARQELLGMERAGYPVMRTAPQPNVRGGSGQ